MCKDITFPFTTKSKSNSSLSYLSVNRIPNKNYINKLVLNLYSQLQFFIRKLDKSLLTSEKNIPNEGYTQKCYQISDRTRTSLCKKKWKHRDFLANGADLILLNKKAEEILFCSMSIWGNCLISTHLLCLSSQVYRKYCWDTPF